MTDKAITEKISLIREIANNVDKKENGGNGNKSVDGSEISVFVQKLEENGISNAKLVINTYNSNKLYNETIFAQKDSTANDSIENAIIGKINADSFLNAQENRPSNEVEDIVNGIHKAVNWGWGPFVGTDYKLLDKKVALIDETNVLKVLNAKYPDKKVNIVSDLIDDIDGTQSDLDKYGYKIINALVNAANKRGIDVSSIVTMDENKKYTKIGPDVEGAKLGESVTNKKYLEKVIFALKDKIESTEAIMTDEEAAKKDIKSTMTTFALQADRSGNNNGILDGDEIAAFKIACANVGIEVNSMLSSIRNKTDDKLNLTADETALKTIFDSKTNLKEKSDNEYVMKTLSKGITQSIQDKDVAALAKYFENINADNIEEVLTALDNNKDFMNLPVDTAMLYDGPVDDIHSDKNDIGNKLIKHFTSNAKEFNKKIISALYSKAQKENINVADIVRESGDDFVIGFGDRGADALDSIYVNEVISKLRQRIKEESGD